ncbi:hypothetical protein [Nocardia sp. NPDC004722]
MPDPLSDRPSTPSTRRFEPHELHAQAAAVTDRESFGALLSRVLELAGISVGAVKSQLSGGRTVYDWFTGAALPRDRADARKLADLLGRALAREHPDIAIAESIMQAWQLADEQRRRQAADRAARNRNGTVEGRRLAEETVRQTEPQKPDREIPPNGNRRPRRLHAVAIVVGALSLVVAGTGAIWWAERHASSTNRAAGDVDCGGPAMVSDSRLLAGPNAVRVNPVLDFGQMFGSAWHVNREGTTYYWAKGNSQPGVRGSIELRWRTGDQPWHLCNVAITGDEGHEDRRTPAIPTIIDGRPVTVRVCLHQAVPEIQNCTDEQ